MHLSATQRRLSFTILTIIWLAIAINYLIPVPPAWLSTTLYWLGIGMGAVHLIEVFIFFNKLEDNTNKLIGVLMLFLFGIIYASSLDENSAS